MSTKMSDKERIERLEGIVDRMADKLSDCVLLVYPLYELGQQIEICGASENLTKASTMVSDIRSKLMNTLGLKTLTDKVEFEEAVNNEN